MVIKEKILITPYNALRTLHIYVPEHIDINNPPAVMYMFDGHNLFFDDDATYGKCWGLKSYLDHMQANVIVIGIECNHHSNKRLCEFSPYSFEDSKLGSVQASGKELIVWIIQQLKPWVESRFTVSNKKEDTIIAGSSMGGLMALYAGCVHAKTFGKAICISPFYGPIYETLYQDIKNSKALSKSSIYISWGYKEYADINTFLLANDHNLAITRLLASKKAQVFPHCFKDGKHCEESWEKEIPSFMKELKIN